MARSGAGRGTRMGRGNLSGTTLTTIPSGVTVDRGGIAYDGTTAVTPAELGYLDDQAGYGVAYTTTAGYGLNAGSAVWAGASLTINHGFTTTLLGLSVTWGHDGGVTSVVVPCVKEALTAGYVSVALYTETAADSMHLAVTGGTMFWMALGI